MQKTESLPQTRKIKRLSSPPKKSKTVTILIATTPELGTDGDLLNLYVPWASSNFAEKVVP